MEKRPKASKKEEEWVVVPRKKDLRKKKGKKPSNTPEQPRHARSEAVLIKPAEEMSYATILRELKKRVNPDELGATVQGIRETRSKDFLVELKYSDLEPTIGTGDVEEAVRGFFNQESEIELTVSLTGRRLFF